MDPSPENLRSITHDMRNLLTAVRGHAELALRGLSAEDPAREDVAHVVVVTAAVFELVDQIDGNNSSDTLIATNLDSAVVAMRRLLDALLPTNIEMDLRTDSDGSFVSISKLRIERIVLNLALNARDAMDDGGKLTVRTTSVADEMAEIVVADTGPGFTEDALQHLFESGFTTKRERGGSGHGLHALQHLLAGIGGSIAVVSEPGVGATVTVRVPTVALDEYDALYGRPDDPLDDEDPSESGRDPEPEAAGEAVSEPQESANAAPEPGPSAESEAEASAGTQPST